MTSAGARDPSAIVLGAGPAGLAAALTFARAGLSPTVFDAAGQVGGLCVTHRRAGFAYDVGGHALFVRDAARLEWLRELLGDDLGWVPRPVASVIDGAVRPGRYLDQGGPPRDVPARADQGGAEYLRSVLGAVGAVGARRYLEKVDGMPLETIPATRVERLLVGQAAPTGFWFPKRGIGQLMDRMAAAIVRAGGRVVSGARVNAIHAERVAVRFATGDVARAARMVVAVPIGHAARLLEPKPPTRVLPELGMRAVAIVYLVIDRPRLTAEPWIQVDDPRVPFARVFEPANWSGLLVSGGRTIIGCECYCSATDADPVWRLRDTELGRRCAHALGDPLRWLDEGAAVRLHRVIRLPRAYPSVRLVDVERASLPAGFLSGIRGIEIAQGGAVIEAIESGEAAARRSLATTPFRCTSEAVAPQSREVQRPESE
ncbi:MAG: FAD-dependent oxidoreductase [Actinobacteria bacterium]|nr:FAD-dependent oxidoreductase [Actinomycetota bacterium]